MYARILAGLALLTLAACGEVGGACGLRLAADVPVRVDTARPLVTLDINGRQGLFLLDSGATTTAMTRRAVARLGVEAVQGGAYSVGGVGGISNAGSAMLRGARLGNITLPDETVTMMPDTSIAGIGGRDGVLGIKHLARYEWDLDLPRSRLRLYDGRPCAGETLPTDPGMVDIRRSWTSRPGFDQVDPRSHVAVTLDGRQTVALLDTGAQASLVFRHSALTMGITAEELARDPTATSRGFGPVPITVARHRFATMQVGGRGFTDQVISVGEFGDSNTATFYEVGMLLGMDYLAKHRVWIAHSRRVVLVPGPATPP